MSKKYYQIKPAPEIVPLDDDGIDPSPEMIPVRTLIYVNGRKEREALLKDHEKMKSLGLDPYYETIVYLGRWGGWLEDE